ncbi:MAG: DEAD/DEAH box helicase [Candidatus Altiarchaeota archaeon]
MFVEHPLVREGKLQLRRYQESIVARAVEESTLVVLPTGLGKTVIAAMVAAHRLQKYPGSRVLFLAPTKPLVVQHMRTFRELLNVEEMCVLTGEDAVEKRREMWVGNRVIFATPQTIQNDVIRGVSLRDVSLVVFDEAHRAVGDYSYVAIGAEYVKSAEHPMSLGLTASPSSERDKVEEICANLRTKYVEAKTDLDSDVKPYIQDVKVHWVMVELPQEFKQVQKLLKAVLKDEIEKLKEFGYVQSSNMGRVNKRALLEAQHKVRGEISSGVEAYAAASTVAAAIKVNHGIELLETQGIAAVDEYFERLRKQGSKAVKGLMKDLALMKAMTVVAKMRKEGVEHPKIEELVRIVSRYKGRKVLVFTQYRDSVDMIIRRLNEADILAHEFIGQAARGLKEGMTQKRQVEVLNKFREGAYTALIATSVAEEGLDIPKVDAVIFYEPVPSEIRTIQRRGRTGRSARGEVYVMIAKGTMDEGYYWAAFHKERKMGEMVRDMRKGLVKQKSIGEYGVVEEEPTAEDNSKGFGQQSLFQYAVEKGSRVKVIVDVRERNSKILSVLKEVCDIELKQLPVGDFLLSDRVCVERKTVGDFLQSIVDKRLMSQLSEMKRNFQIPVLILEGRESIYSQRNIHPNAARGALAAIAVDFNVPVIPTENEEDTARMLYMIARREQEESGRPVALRGERKPQLLKEKQRFIVESLPNVSAVLADRLLERFNSVEAVMTTGRKELQAIEGIGEKKAEEIRRVVKSRYGEGDESG